jgi:hypothetical protein
LETLKKKGAELEYPDPNMFSGAIRGMFWRFFVSADPTVDRFLVRDADSRLSLREKFAVDEWIASGKGVHTMRDHQNHNYPFNGGMWGAVKGAVPNLIELSKRWDRNNYIADMNLLASIYPQVQHNLMSHDSYHCIKWGAKTFPTRRFAKEHVGGVFDANDNPRIGDMDIMKPTPVECRREPDWTYS